MTTEEKARAYDEALEKAQKATRAGSDVVMDIVQYIFPQLAESEDERTREWLLDYFKSVGESWIHRDISPEQIIAYLEKQKEQKPVDLQVKGDGVYKICPRCKERMVRDDSMVYTSMSPQYRYECPKCGESECDTVMYDNPEMEEQKPVKVGENAYFDPNTDMWFIKKKQKLADLSEMMVHKEPYIAPVPTPMVADEQKPVDYEAELKKCKDNPLYFYDKYVSIKQKQEWSEEDERNIRNLESILYYEQKLPEDTRAELGDFLKSLRPSWKPSEEQMTNLLRAEGRLRIEGESILASKLAELYKQLKKL